MLRILNGHSLTTKALLYPESMGLNLSERDSTATPNAGPKEPQAAIGEWLQDMDEPGAGIVWRVKTIDRQYNTDTITYNLEHAIRTLADRILPKEVKASDMGGSGDTCTAKQAAQYILGKQSDWVLGDFEYNVSNPYRFSGETLLAALETVTGSLEDPVWEYDFTVYPFKLHIRQQSDNADSELRAGRNITTLKYTIDRSRMYTRFYPVGKNNLRLSGNGYVSRNENTYGRVDKTETDQSKDTEAKLTAWANERLKRHAEPQVTVTISGMDLSESTGESLDKVKISRYKCRVPLPEYGTTILEKVTKLSWRDKIRDKESVTVTLANALADVQSIIKEEKARGGGGSRTAAELNEENEILIGNVESGLYTRITQTASELRQEAHDEARSLRSIISQTAESIRLTVESDVESLRSQIVQTAESIRLEVTNEAASLRSQIVQTAESIRSEVANEAASLRSSITQTAESIRAEVADESASIRSVITQTAASIRSEITDEASSLRSEITQQAGRIDLVVSGSGASAAIRLSAIVDGINQSQLELSADRVVIGSGSNKKAVKVYIDGEITATEGQITNLKTGTTKATLINSDAITADGISATEYMYTPSMTIGSGTQGGSGTLYFRGNQYYRQGVTMGPSTNYFIEGHFLGDNSTTLNLNHYHTIVATEGTGADAGKIILTLTDPVATSDTTNHTTNFNIAATTAYQNGVLAAKNAVKVQPFTADARQGALNDHRQFTYTTDAPTPSAGTPQADTWYIVPTGTWSSNKTTVNLRYGSASGTAYASVEVNASSVATAAGYAGRAAVGLADPTADAKTQTDDNRTFTVSTTGRTNSSGTADNVSKTVPLHLYAGSWSSNKKTVYMKWGASGGSSGTTYAQIEVDAGTLVTNAGYAGRAEVTLNDPTWNAITGAITDSRTLSVTTSGRTNSSGTTDNLTKSMALYLTSSGLTVTLRAGSSSGTAVASKTCSDANLVAGNIKSGVSIFGVTGSYAPSDTVTIYPASNQSLNPGGSVTVYARKNGSNVANIKVSANTDSNLKAANIKSGVTIFGVTGTYAASVANDDIQIGGYNNVSTEPSGTTANTMRDTIIAAQNLHNWFRFKVTVTGTSAVKYYKFKFS